MRLYHNPRCSKSRQAFALLTERDLSFEDYRYLERGVASEDLVVLLSLDDLIRQNELDSSKDYDLENKAEVKQLIMANPKALQRPILIVDGSAVIGRPPEKILQLLK